MDNELYKNCPICNDNVDDEQYANGFWDLAAKVVKAIEFDTDNVDNQEKIYNVLCDFLNDMNYCPNCGREIHSGNIYVCYEKNRHTLLVESDEVEDLTVFKDVSGAANWILEKIKKGKENSFIIDNETPILDFDVVKKEVENSGYFSVVMFLNYQENWDESYDIIIERTEVK